MNDFSLSETTKEYLEKLDRLDRDLSSLCQRLESETTADSYPKYQGSLPNQVSSPDENLQVREDQGSLPNQVSSPDENLQVRERVETIRNAFRTIRTEFSTLASFSGLQPTEEVATGTGLSGLSSQAVRDVAKIVLENVATVCK